MVKRLLSGVKGPFSDRERAIFTYFDGHGRAAADPFEVQRLLEKHGGRNWMDLLSGLRLGGGIDLDKLSPQIRESIAVHYQDSVTKLSDLVRLAFHVGPLRMVNGKTIGLVDSECLKLLCDFFDFLNSLEEEYRPLLLPPMEESPSADDSTTEPLSESHNADPPSDENEQKIPLVE